MLKLFKRERSKGFCGEPLKHVITLRGQILASRTDDDLPPAPPYVDSTRPRVHVQNVPMCTGTTRTCVATCARGACMHGDVLNVHTGFSACHTIPHHTHNDHAHKTPHAVPHTTSHGDRGRDRERKRKRKKTEKERAKGR